MKVVLLVLQVLISSAALAESPNQQFGRLPSGEAYRTDKQGYRLVDQLAELEVSNHDLNKQVVALEDELVQNRRLIESLRAGTDIERCDTVKETSLVGSSLPAPKLPGSELANQAINTDSTLITQLRAEQVQLKEKIRELETQLASRSGDQELALLRATLKNKELQLEEQRKQITMLTAGVNDRNQSNATLAKLEEDFRAEQEKTKKLQKKLAALSKPTRTTPQAEVASAGYVRGALASRTEVARASASAEDLRLAKTQLADIQNLITKRKSLLDSLKQSRSSVSVSIQPLVAKNGLSLDRLRAQVSPTTADAELQTVTRSLNEIQSLLKEDIALLSRIAKIS